PDGFQRTQRRGMEICLRAPAACPYPRRGAGPGRRRIPDLVAGRPAPAALNRPSLATSAAGEVGLVSLPALAEERLDLRRGGGAVFDHLAEQFEGFVDVVAVEAEFAFGVDLRRERGGFGFAGHGCPLLWSWAEPLSHPRCRKPRDGEARLLALVVVRR